MAPAHRPIGPTDPVRVTVRRPGSSPAADPEPPLLVYDGECGFCQRWARWLGRRAPGLRFVPFQDIGDLGRYGLTAPEVERASYWVDDRGRGFGGNRSIAKVLQQARGGWRAIGLLLDLPLVRPLVAVAYRLIARNRHRLPAPRG